jgi:hypothetical protein
VGAGLLLAAPSAVFAVGISAGATNTPIPPASFTATPVLYVPQTPRPTTTTATILITFTPTSTPLPGAPPAPTATKTFTPLPTATSIAASATPAATTTAASATPAATTTPLATATSTPAQPAWTAAPSSTPVAPAGTQPPAGSGIVINEVLSNPQKIAWDRAGSEPISEMAWLELYNVTGSGVDVHGWFIVAGDPNHPAVLGLGTVIPANGYLVLFGTLMGLNLANNPISLADAYGNAIDSISVPSLPADQSYARIPDGSSNWQIDPSPTLGGANVLLAPAATPDLQATAAAIETLVAQPLPSPPAFDDDLPDATDQETGRRSEHPRKGQPYQSLSIAEIRGLADDAPVTTSGVVTLPTGLWETSRAYIQDQAGILIHVFGDQQLRLGDSATIRGRVHHFHGEVEIAAVKGGLQVSAGGAVPDAVVTAPGGVGPGTEALLVEIGGRVSSVARDYAIVADDAGSARVFLYAKLGSRPESLVVGQPVGVTGVVNSAGQEAQAAAGTDPRQLSGSHRLLPRSLADIIIGALAAAPGSAEDRARSRSRGSAAGQPEGSSRAAGPGLAFPGATPTPFVTPVLSGQKVGSAAGQPGAATLMLLGGGIGRGPGWVWTLIAVGAGLVAGGGASAVLWWRQRRAKAGMERVPAEEEPRQPAD